MAYDDQPARAGRYSRYVALGDSQTEGVGDGDELDGYRGLADRFAELLAAANPEIRYANLAVRGRLAGQVRAEQLEPALALRPDLVSVVAGVNDLIRPSFDGEVVVRHLEAMFAELAATGAHVLTLTFPDLGRVMPVARLLSKRVADFNADLVAAAGRHGVTVVDTATPPVCGDPRLWCVDRLHLNTEGHARVAAAFAEAVGLPGSDDAWSRPLPAPPPRSALAVARDELRWAATFVGPWVVRRIRGRSSGDGRSAKRPDLRPVRPGEDTLAET